MKRLKVLRLALVAVVAVSAVTASAASAVEGPFYKVTGARLLEGQHEEIEASAEGNQELSAGLTKVVCKKVEVKAGGTIIGSTGANAGTSKETLVYKECEVKGNGEPCSVTEPVETKPLKNTLGYAANARGGKVLTLFEPESGTEYATLKFSGAGCVVTETKVKVKTGASGVICEDLNGKKESIEVGKGEEESESGFIKCPSPKITSIWVESGGALAEKKGGLEAFGVEANYFGTSKVKLKTKKAWGVFTK
jgi:hypothetical protein